MALIRGVLCALALAAYATPARADEDHLAPLAFLNGCWDGTFDGPQHLRDERCFTTILNGHAVRDAHNVLGTGYGGETTYVWNAETQRIEVSYVANDGGLMTGRVEQGADGALVFLDSRYIGADGHILLLRSRWERQGEGFAVVTEEQLNGAWRPMMRISYVPAHIGE